MTRLTCGICDEHLFAVRIGDVELATCRACGWWVLQPSLPFASECEQPSDKGESYRGRHRDRNSDLAAVESDYRGFYA